LITATLLATPTLGAEDPSPAPPNEQDTLLYAVGLAVGQSLGPLRLSEAELVQIQKGIADVALGREPKVDLTEWAPRLQAFAQQRLTELAAVEAGESATILDAALPGRTRTESGLIYSELVTGTGASPVATDVVTVHYQGSLRDGSVFDSSIERGEPATFPLQGVIPCWTEGVQRMKVGGKSRLVCPASLGYGDRGVVPEIPGGAALVFEVELLGIEPVEPEPAPVPTPTDG
jgi:FKBP-type peptidyl-prolyl cis-trans isomerase FkpA